VGGAGTARGGPQAPAPGRGAAERPAGMGRGRSQYGTAGPQDGSLGMRAVLVRFVTSGGGRTMRSRKLLATMTLVALLGSDLVLAASPALGQTPTPGNGYPTGNGYPVTPTPALGGADGADGRVLPGPSTTAPYV